MIRKALLLAPATLWIGVFLALPLGLMAYVSTLQRGDGGGVIWGAHTVDAYVQFLFERDLADRWVLNTDYLRIFARSIWLAGLTMVLCGLIAFPTALWMAFQPPRLRLLLVFIVTVPFWTNLLVRTYAWILLLRTGGVIEQVLAWLGLGGVRVDVLYTPWATLMDASPCAVIAARMASAPSMAALAPISDGDAQSRMFRMGWSDPLCVG